MKPFLALVIINIIFFANSQSTTNSTSPTTTTPTTTNTITPNTTTTAPTTTNTTTPNTTTTAPTTTNTTPNTTNTTTPTTTNTTTPNTTNTTTPTTTTPNTTNTTTPNTTTPNTTTTPTTTTPNTTTTPTTTAPTTTNSTSPKEKLPQKILLGFDNYNYNQASKILSFITYIRDIIEKPTANLVYRIGITRYLRRLEEVEQKEDITCKLTNENNKENIYKYNCTLENVTGSISKVKIYTTDIEKTKLAEKMGENLQYATGDKFSEKGIIIMNGCEIQETNNNKYIIITGKNDTSLDNEDLTLYVVQDNGNIEDVPTKLNYIDNRAKMILRPRRSIHTDSLDGTVGKIDKGKNVFLSFTGSNSTVSYDVPSNNGYKRNSSKGLSTGGIIAIIIPCILVLLAVGAVAFFLGRKTPDPQTQNLTNTGVINSSANIVN